MTDDAERGWPPLDQRARAHALARQASLTKPTGSLGRLEDVAMQLAAIQGRERPSVRPAAVLLFAADHPVARHQVSAYPSSVTAAMVSNFAEGGAAAAVLARAAGVTLRVVDVGVEKPLSSLGDEHVIRSAVAEQAGSGDIRAAEGLTPALFAAARAAGAREVERLGDLRLLMLGEMGIGNTTIGSALAAAQLGLDPNDAVGPGTGIGGPALTRKREVVRDGLAALERRHGTEVIDPEAVLCGLGGRDVAAILGAAERACEKRIPVLVDGFVVSVAMLMLEALRPGARDRMLFAHRSAEPAHALVLDALDARPLLDLSMRLGEASGALTAFPVVDLACQLHAGMATFEEAAVPGRVGSGNGSDEPH